MPAHLPSLSLVIGGARSGKSAFAESLAAGAPERVYVATAEPFDEEMRERVARHRARRGAGWRTVEAPLELATTLGEESAPERVLLVDCLTVWLGNLVHHGRDLDSEIGRLVESLAALAGPAVLVANEVGMSVVPENRMARQFRDDAGRLNQRVAARADRVHLVVAGIDTLIKG